MGGFNCPNVVYMELKRYKVVLTCSCINKFPRLGVVFLIVDESIKMKNFEAKRTQRMLTLGNGRIQIDFEWYSHQKNVMDI
jgi:hypothetical protein